MGEKYGWSPATLAVKEPIELKIGQVWDWGVGGHEIIALGPQHVVAVCRPYPAVVYSKSYWARIAHNRLLRPKHELWVNVYSGCGGYIRISHPHPSKDVADLECSDRAARIACLKIEFEEGDGL